MLEGGLLLFGMVVLMFAPLIAAKLRGTKTSNEDFKSPEELNAFVTEVGGKLRAQGQIEAADMLTSIQKTAFTARLGMAQGNSACLFVAYNVNSSWTPISGGDLKRIMRAVVES